MTKEQNANICSYERVCVYVVEGLRVAYVVWLRASLSTLEDRSEGKPLGDEELEVLAHEREPLYRDVADLIVDVNGKSPDQIVEIIVAELSG